MNITSTGFLAILVDEGRKAVRHQGFTEAGAMDKHSFYLANTLVGNSISAPAIEILIGRFEAILTCDLLVSVTGADCDIFVNDERFASNTPIFAAYGSKLLIVHKGKGARSYLAFSASINTSQFANSQTTCLSENNGGLEGNGNALSVSSKLDLRPKIKTSEINRRICVFNQHSKEILPLITSSQVHPKQHYSLEFISAYQSSLFTHLDFVRFCNQVYTVSSDSNRMGVRLHAKPLNTRHIDFGLLSEGMTLGAIQIMPNGLPTIMMQERQTIGGYPKIGCLTPRSISKMGQCLPENSVEFKQTDLYSARQEFLMHNRALKVLASVLKGNEKCLKST
ncbi:biotin-dependent carboxyltransferase family protein [Glaciecola sp. KUL10]|uniref:5-oxoprolinase subunit C family protein n=1 Tax=Glaciecola sp. (strain KUL10) TaxID=2161813 RepID=UPI000D787B52|nr:hypothetical protein [Glaciecola sp. KUL10]GBL02784.1 antagonist of KipI [Glaciecola sp. KUL10]